MSSIWEADIPFGVFVVVILGGLFAALKSIVSFLALTIGSGPVVIALPVFALTIGQLLALRGLLALDPLALLWAFVLFGIGALVNFVLLDFPSFVVSLVIIAYLPSTTKYFE